MPLSTYKFSTKLFWPASKITRDRGSRASAQWREGWGHSGVMFDLETKLQQSILFNLTNKQRTWPIHTAQLCWIRVKYNPSMPCVRSPFFPHLILLWVTCTPPYYCSDFQMNSFTPNTPFLLNRNSSDRARLKNVPSRSKGWVDFPAGQVMFNIHFSNRQGSKQKNLSLNH